MEANILELSSGLGTDLLVLNNTLSYLELDKHYLDLDRSN